MTTKRRKTLTVCSEPHCPNDSYGGRCTTCTRTADTQRPTATQRGYDTGWQRNRARFLQAHPTCTDCEAKATVADHSPVTRRELQDAGEPHPDAWQHLQPRCDSCHSRKTATNDGGFGNQPR